MKKHQDEINETIMYLSRLLDKHTNIVDAQANALIFTIQVKDLYNPESFEPPPLKWSAPIVRKAEDQEWRLRDPSQKRLS